MASKTKKIHAAGKFSGGIGVRARNEFNAIEADQRKAQQSPFHPKGKAKRIAAGSPTYPVPTTTIFLFLGFSLSSSSVTNIKNTCSYYLD